MRINEIWKCVRQTPEQTLRSLMEEEGADSGDFTRVTLDNFDELFSNEDRLPKTPTMREKVRKLVADGVPMYWFTIHC